MMNLIVLLSMLFTASPAATATEEEKAVITFEQNTIKLGEVYPGEKYERVFKFTNTGTAPLIIKDIEKACGCTVVKFDTEPVMPGASGEIKVDFIPREDYGFASKSFVITSNAKNNPEHIYLHGTIVKKEKNK
jgi:hypothetical protein